MTDKAVHDLQKLVEDEKTELARLIHDELGGHLIATSMDLAFLRHRWEKSDPISLEKIERATKSLSAAVMMMRQVTEDLRPTLIDNVGLFAALRWYVTNTCRRSKLVCHEELPESELTLTSTTGIALFRAVQDMFLVAEQHHGATRINFKVTTSAGALRTEVIVDGAAAPPPDSGREESAMVSLRHRVGAWGGTVSFNVNADSGFTLRSEIDLDRLQGPRSS